MYESFFQLGARPFLAAPFAERYFPAASIEHARETVARCVERAEGPAVILGAAGTGKSTLCHVLADQLRDQFQVAILASARLCTRRALLQNILFELKLPYRDREEGELRLSLIDHLAPSETCPHGMLLLVDEAHMLPLRLLEEIRMITNLVHDGQPRVRLVLAASLALDERLASPRLESFNQRIAARCYLQSMNREDTCGYIRSQISAVGGDPGQIFTEDAMCAVYRATDGIPRLVNQVCDHVLMMAAIGRHAPIEASGVEEAWADLQQLPTPWATQDVASGSTEPTDVLEFGELDDVTCGELDGGDSVVHDTQAPVAENAVADATARLDEIEAGVSAIGEEHSQPRPEPLNAEQEGQFRPPPESDPEIELIFHHAHNPFSERFEEEEEVIVDPYASLEALAGTLTTDSGAGDQTIPFCNAEPLTDALEKKLTDCDPVLPETADEEPSAVASVARELGELPGDDRDLVDIHDDLNESNEDCPAAQGGHRPKRREYRQLFASLRRQ